MSSAHIISDERNRTPPDCGSRLIELPIFEIWADMGHTNEKTHGNHYRALIDLATDHAGQSGDCSVRARRLIVFIVDDDDDPGNRSSCEQDKEDAASTFKRLTVSVATKAGL